MPYWTVEIAKTRETVTLGEARQVIAAAGRKSEEIGQPEDIAVVDAAASRWCGTARSSAP